MKSLFEAYVNFEPYIRELSDPSQPLSVSRLVNLSNIGPEETSLFTTAWLEMDLRRRQRIIQELVDLAEDNVELNFDAVYFIALADRDPEVRRAAIAGLWEHEGRDLINPLIGLLETDPDAAVRAEAALALGRFVVQGEFGTVGSVDMGRIDSALRRVVRDGSEVAEVRGRALEAVGARSEAWVRDLIEENLESAERRVRISAIHAMGRSCDPAWLPDLLAELNNDDPEMRYEAASALGAIADEGATGHLVILLEDDDADVREAAIGALGEIATDEAREAIEPLLESDDERTREAAEEALAEANFARDPLGLGSST